MNILITNDDGIWAPGIQALVQKIAPLGNVAMVAPLEEKSAIGHGITIREPICVQTLEIPGADRAWGVNGTPADCVKLALTELLPEKCDVVISGINNGPNMGTDVLYSGTVSAAIEGILLGVPALAISLAEWETEDYSVAAEVTVTLLQYLQQNKYQLPPGILFNINVPAVSKEKLAGLKITELGPREYEHRYEKRLDPRGNPYYWAVGDVLPLVETDLTFDVIAVENNYVSVTPLQIDLTAYKIIPQIKKWGLEGLRKSGL